MHPERRENDSIMLAHLEKIEKQTNGGLKDQFKDLKDSNQKLWEKHDIEAKEFRAEVRADIRELLKVLSDRPCVAHTEQIKDLFSTRILQNTIIIALLGTIILGLVRWGELHRQVEVNTKKWEKLDEMSPMPKRFDAGYLPQR